MHCLDGKPLINAQDHRQFGPKDAAATSQTDLRASMHRAACTAAATASKSSPVPPSRLAAQPAVTACGAAASLGRMRPQNSLLHSRQGHAAGPGCEQEMSGGPICSCGRGNQQCRFDSTKWGTFRWFGVHNRDSTVLYRLLRNLAIV